MANERDILNHSTTLTVFYGIPILAMVATGPLAAPHLITGAVWAVSLGVMGGACLWNARHCGRVHCYFTGPFFLVLGIIAMVHGLDLLSLGSRGWQWLGGVLLIGGIGLYVLPEKVWGSYRKSQ